MVLIIHFNYDIYEFLCVRISFVYFINIQVLEVSVRLC